LLSAGVLNMEMDVEFLKKIDFPLRVIKIKPDQQSFSDKKKKSKLPEKEEKKKNKIDVRV
jgi:hypothetical protein